MLFFQSKEFDSKHHGSLQDMWYKAHYKEAESTRQRSLGKLERFSLKYFVKLAHFMTLFNFYKACVLGV